MKFQKMMRGGGTHLGRNQRGVRIDAKRGVSGGTFVAHLAFVCLAIGSVLLTGACNFILNKNDNGQAQGITSPSDTVSPSPTAECALGAIQPGTVDDVREIQAGGTIGIGVSLFGPQGLELVSSCLSQYTVTWSTASGPCSFVGGHDGLASAPADATPGATCTGAVDVGGKHGTLSLVVVP